MTADDPTPQAPAATQSAAKTHTCRRRWPRKPLKPFKHPHCGAYNVQVHFRGKTTTLSLHTNNEDEAAKLCAAGDAILKRPEQFPTFAHLKEKLLDAFGGRRFQQEYSWRRYSDAVKEKAASLRRQNPRWSDRRIARECRVQKGTMRHWRVYRDACAAVFRKQTPLTATHRASVRELAEKGVGARKIGMVIHRCELTVRKMVEYRTGKALCQTKPPPSRLMKDKWERLPALLREKPELTRAQYAAELGVSVPALKRRPEWKAHMAELERRWTTEHGCLSKYGHGNREDVKLDADGNLKFSHPMFRKQVRRTFSATSAVEKDIIGKTLTKLRDTPAYWGNRIRAEAELRDAAPREKQAAIQRALDAFYPGVDGKPTKHRRHYQRKPETVEREKLILQYHGEHSDANWFEVSRFVKSQGIPCTRDLAYKTWGRLQRNAAPACALPESPAVEARMQNAGAGQGEQENTATVQTTAPGSSSSPAGNVPESARYDDEVPEARRTPGLPAEDGATISAALRPGVLKKVVAAIENGERLTGAIIRQKYKQKLSLLRANVRRMKADERDTIVAMLARIPPK